MYMMPLHYKRWKHLMNTHMNPKLQQPRQHRVRKKVRNTHMQVVALANRPGFPFLGNDFFREMGDCCLLQMRSQLGVLSSGMVRISWGRRKNRKVSDGIESFQTLGPTNQAQVEAGDVFSGFRQPAKSFLNFSKIEALPAMPSIIQTKSQKWRC